jgi:uncharacterized protein (TIGR03435 family)
MVRRVALGVAALACCAFGQATATPPAFEVAAIQPTPPPPEGGVAPGHLRQNPGGIDYSSATVSLLIRKAYGLQDYQLVLPPGISQARWNVVARAPAGSSLEQIPLMLQRLLAERFQLQVHREKKEVSAFALIEAKGGVKIKPVDVPEGPFTGARMPNGGMRLFGKVSMEALAQALTPSMQKPVVDLTGLAGVYDVSFEIVRDESPAETASVPGMSISYSMEKTLGLKLEPRKIPMEVLVVDHVEKTPSGN